MMVKKGKPWTPGQPPAPRPPAAAICLPPLRPGLPTRLSTELRGALSLWPLSPNRRNHSFICYHMWETKDWNFSSTTFHSLFTAIHSTLCRLMNNICSLLGRPNLLKQEAHEVGDEKWATDVKRLEPCSSPRKRSRPEAFRNSPLGIRDSMDGLDPVLPPLSP